MSKQRETPNARGVSLWVTRRVLDLVSQGVVVAWAAGGRMFFLSNEIGEEQGNDLGGAGPGLPTELVEGLNRNGVNEE